MPWFRRREQAPSRETFTVGVDGHRVLLGEPAEGCRFLGGIDEWVEAVARRDAARPRSDGRDSIALLNAKMDYAEMVDDAMSVVVLAFEELVERGVLEANAVPDRPPRDRLGDRRTYDYIQHAHARAVERRAWLRAADALLREHGVTVEAPERPAEG